MLYEGRGVQIQQEDTVDKVDLLMKELGGLPWEFVLVKSVRRDFSKLGSTERQAHHTDCSSFKPTRYALD